MKKQFFSFTLAAVLFMSCASTDTPPSSKASSTSVKIEKNSDITEKEWRLIEVYVDGKNTEFSREARTLFIEKNLPIRTPEAAENFFTLKFDGQNISGIGAPNHYSAPYSLNIDDQTVSIKLIRSTMMASFFELQNINEHEFFIYMQNTYALKLAKNNLELLFLELLSKTKDGDEVRLVFSL